MNKVIILNAPPNAGKDTIAAALCKRLGLPHMEYKRKLFELAMCISGLSQEEWDELYTRENKETPTSKLFGLSPRDFMICISEEMIKPVCGKDYFGIIAGKAVKETGAVFSDGGFNDETEPLCDIVGADRVYVVRFTREGCSFQGDSRNFIDTPVVKNYLDTTNNGTIEEFCDRVIDWIGG